MAQPNDFGFGKEAQMLKSEARKFFKDNCDERTLHERVAATPDPYRQPECLWDRKLWENMGKLEWPALAVPEAAGGMGMSAVTVAALVEEVGRAALPSPLNATINAAYVLSGCESDSARRILEKIANGQAVGLALAGEAANPEKEAPDLTATVDDTGVILTGTAGYVQDAGKVDCLIAAARSEKGVGLYIVPMDAAGLTVVADAIVDLTRDQARVHFQKVRLDAEQVAAPPEKGNTVLHNALPIIWTMTAADMCGAAEWQLQTTAAYARERHQFDRPIGFFQAVKHPLVNMMMMIDEARSLMYNAACAWDHEPEQCRRYAHMAKAAAGDMAAFCSGRSVQLHGGFGFTWESVVHIYFKRQLHSQVLYGDAAWHRARLADMLMGPVTG